VNELNKKVAEARQNHALDQPGGALHGGGFFMSMKAATAAAGALASRARRFHFLEIYKAFTSKPLKRLRRTNKRRRASAINQQINWFLGRASRHSHLSQAPLVANQSKVKLVLIGDGSRMSGIKGTKSSVPWAVLRRRFAQRARNEGFMALLNNEHCTSIKSAYCGVRNRKAYKNKDINYRLVRPQLPAAAVLTPHLPKMWKVSALERGGPHQPSARGHLHAQRLGMAAMAPPRATIQQQHARQGGCARAAYPRPGRAATRCPTYTRCRPPTAPGTAPGHGPRARPPGTTPGHGPRARPPGTAGLSSLERQRGQGRPDYTFRYGESLLRRDSALARYSLFSYRSQISNTRVGTGRSVMGFIGPIRSREAVVALVFALVLDARWYGGSARAPARSRVV
jgi:hypothetical protein